MADRSVIVSLIANVAGYLSPMAAAAAATRNFAGSTAAASVAAAEQKKALTTLAAPVAGLGAVLLGVGVAAAVMAAKFDAQMSVVKANIDDKSVPSMKRLAAAALEAGRTTAYSATDAARAEEELAKAGLTSSQIVGGALAASLSLASAGQLDLGTAAEITASTMVQFNLKASDAAHIADVLAAGADKSLGGVTDLAEGLKYSGVAASQFGVSLDTTVGLLADFASAGIIGSMAGTGLREMLVRLANPTKEASADISTLGLHFFDASGKFLGMANVAEQLKTKLSGLSDQQRQQTLVTLFGTRSMAEANILYQQGAAGVNKWSDAVNEQGFASQQAATKLDNLNGDLTKLKNSLNAAMIVAGEGAQGPLRDLAKGATNAVNAFSNMSPAAQSMAVDIAAGAGAVLLAGAGFVTLSVKIGETVKAFKELQIASKLSFLAGPWGVAIAAATIAAGFFIKSQLDAAAATSALQSTLDAQTGAITDNTRAKVAQTLQDQGVLDAANRLKLSLSDVTDAALGSAPALDRVTTSVHTSGSAWDMYGESAQNAGHDIKTVLSAVNGSNDALKGAVVASKNIAEAQGAATDASTGMSKAETENAKAIKEQADAAQSAATENDNLLKSLSEVQNLLLGARGAERNFQASIDDATASLKANGKTLDTNTAKGRANSDAIDKIASSTIANVTATFKNRDATTSLSAAVGAAEKQVNAGRVAFISSATSMGMSRAAAGKLADQLGLTKRNVDTLSATIQNIPTEATTTLKNNAPQFNAEVEGARRKLASLDGSSARVTITANIAPFASALAQAQARSIFTLPGHSDGGYTGNGGVGDIAGFVHGKEYVLNAAATARLGISNLDALNSGQVQRLTASASPTAAAPPTAGQGLQMTNHYHGVTDPAQLSARVRNDLMWELTSR